MDDQKKSPEYDAFQAVYGALNPLTPEDRAKVINSVSALLGIIEVQPLSEGKPKEAGRKIGLAELVKDKVATTNPKKIAVYAYFRERVQNLPKFSRAQLKDYFALAKDSPPTNYDRDFSEAVRKGWIHEEGENSYLTTTGTEAVESGFPGERRYKSKPRPKKSKN